MPPDTTRSGDRDTTVMDEVQRTLRASEVFSALPETSLRRLAAESELKIHPRGARIWNRGDRCPSVLVVSAGRLKCWVEGDEGREWVLDVIGARACAGLIALMDAGPLVVNAETLERSRIVHVPVDAVWRLLERDHRFALHLALIIARDLRRVVSSCEAVALRSPIVRLARYLTTLMDAQGVCELRETQSQIASRIGTVREVVGRSLGRLEAEGIVARAGRTVRVLRPSALARLAR